MEKFAFSEEKIRAVVKKHQVDDAVCLVGIRSFFNRGVKKRGVWDDAIFIVHPYGVEAFQANCDPAFYKHGIANLDPGCYLYKPGIHGLSKPKALRYWAFVQASMVSLTRDGGKKERGYFGINIHRGGLFGKVSSIGCQTLKRDEWEYFYKMAREKMTGYGQETIQYILEEAA